MATKGPTHLRRIAFVSNGSRICSTLVGIRQELMCFLDNMELADGYLWNAIDLPRPARGTMGSENHTRYGISLFSHLPYPNLTNRKTVVFYSLAKHGPGG
jgi:hypothetical protein